MWWRKPISISTMVIMIHAIIIISSSEAMHHQPEKLSFGSHQSRSILLKKMMMKDTSSRLATSIEPKGLLFHKIRGGATSSMKKNQQTNHNVDHVLSENESSMESSNNIHRRSLTVVLSVSFLLMVSASLVAFAPAAILVSKMGSTERATSTLSSLLTGAAVLEIMASPICGRLLDSCGRKPVFMTVLSAIAISQWLVVATGESIWSVCSCKVVGSLSIGLFFQTISQVLLSDLTGLSSSSSSKKNQNNPEQLSSALGMQSALISAGFLFGALGAGQLISRFNFSVTYGMAALMSTFNVLFVFLGMAETQPTTSTTSSTTTTQPSRTVIKSHPLSSLLACTRIMTRHGRTIQMLALIFALQCLPTFMGDVFQMYCMSEFNFDTKAFTNLFAMIGVLGIGANIWGSILVRQLGMRQFTSLTTFLSFLPSLGAVFFGYKGLLTGYFIGFLSFAQNLGILASMASEAKSRGIPIGELAGDRAALIGVVKVIGPIWYSTLYLQGKTNNIPQLPFIFNACLGMVVFALCQFCL